MAQPAEGAAGEEAQVSSKPVEWPTVPPGSKRQRSRLHQTPGSAPAGAAPEEISPHPVWYPRLADVHYKPCGPVHFQAVSSCTEGPGLCVCREEACTCPCARSSSC